jgi:hypothetical protein
MRPRHSFVYILAVLLVMPLFGAVASAATIEAIESFDFPGTGNATLPQKINDHGVIVGVFIDPSGVARGFYRSRNGRFSDPFVEPNDTGNLTQGRGINNRRTICGEYLDGSSGAFHGYFLSHTIFTEFDVTDALDTIPLGINNAGDFVGSVILSDGVTQLGFASLGGAISTFDVPGAAATLAYQINDSDQIAGYYIDGTGITHGYTRESDGTMTVPIDPPGSTGTILFGNNDSNWVVGRYADSSGVTHGLFFITPGDFVTYDYPGATFTSLNGINQQGFICGRYVDAAGIVHGFLAKVNPNAVNEPNHNDAPLARVKPAKPTPDASAINLAR